MKHYKFTCIKDTPQVEKGFSYSFREELLEMRNYSICYSHDRELDEKIHWLRAYGEDSQYKEYVEKELDLDYAVKELRCPKCNTISLFSERINEDREVHIADVGTYWYDDTGLQCGVCGWSVILDSVCTKKKIDW